MEDEELGDMVFQLKLKAATEEIMWGRMVEDVDLPRIIHQSIPATGPAVRKFFMPVITAVGRANLVAAREQLDKDLTEMVMAYFRARPGLLEE